MRNVRVALAQIAPRLGDVRYNLDLHLRTAERARRERAQVLVFPELSLTGYVLRDQVPEVAQRLEGPVLERLRRACRRLDIVLGLVEEGPGHRFYNAAVYLADGAVRHVHRKVYLPTYGMFDEGRDFAAGDRVRIFQAGFGAAGILICEDAWHPALPWLLAQQGAEVLFVLSSGPTRGARPGRGVTSVAVWHDLLRVTAQFQTAWVVYVNRVGYEDGLNFGGGSSVMDPFGRAHATLSSLDPDFVVAELDGEILRRARTAYPLLRDEDLELVARELARIRALRYELPGEVDAAAQGVARGAPHESQPAAKVKRAVQDRRRGDR